MYSSGDIVITFVPFTDSNNLKKRPALILYKDYNNYIVSGITSNLNMKGIILTKQDGLIKDSVLKTNYIFTIPKTFILKKITKLNKSKRKIIYDEILKNLNNLIKW